MYYNMQIQFSNFLFYFIIWIAAECDKAISQYGNIAFP